MSTETKEGVSFATYKKSNKKKNVSTLLTKLQSANEKQKKDYSDDRQYKYTKDKAGNALAVLRFLPSKNDLPPVISTYKHAFQYRGKWFIEGCPTTIKGKCPVCEDNGQFFQEHSTENDKNVGRQRSRKKEYYSNVLVLKDSENKELEGKVMIWKFGQKVYEKIMAQLQPEFDSDDTCDVFDLFEGKNFKLKIRTVAGYSNYDQCEFSQVVAVNDDESEIEKVYNEIYDLSEFIDPKNYKSYDEVKNKFQNVVGTGSVTQTLEEKVASDDTVVNTDSTTTISEDSEDSEDNEEDDDYFKNLS